MKQIGMMKKLFKKEVKLEIYQDIIPEKKNILLGITPKLAEPNNLSKHKKFLASNFTYRAIVKVF